MSATNPQPFESLPTSYIYLIAVMEMMPMKDLMMDYVTGRLMYEMSKHKEKEPQSEDVIMMSRSTKGGNSFIHQGACS